MINKEKMQWLASELVSQIDNERSDSPCEYYGYKRKDLPICKRRIGANQFCDDCLIEHIEEIKEKTND
jgi:hypothetical protein